MGLRIDPTVRMREGGMPGTIPRILIWGTGGEAVYVEPGNVGKGGFRRRRVL